VQLAARFGLKDDSPNRWDDFMLKVSQLNSEAESGIKYKVFFFLRHGEGYRVYFTLWLCCGIINSLNDIALLDNIDKVKYGDKILKSYCPPIL
jgi:hypothetical protein